MKYFTVKELTASKTAQKMGISNWPQKEEYFENMNALVEKVLDPARIELNRAIYVNSCYRCPAVNKAVGGVKNSAHLRAAAADIYCSGDMEELWKILLKLPHDQLIKYKHKHFIHVSYERERPNRGQVLYQ